MPSAIESRREGRLPGDLGCRAEQCWSMSSKPQSVGIIGAPFSKGQVSKSLALNNWSLAEKLRACLIQPDLKFVLKSFHHFTSLYNYGHKSTYNIRFVTITPNLSHSLFYLNLLNFSFFEKIVLSGNRLFLPCSYSFRFPCSYHYWCYCVYVEGDRILRKYIFLVM